MESSVIVCDSCKEENAVDTAYCTTCNQILQNHTLNGRYRILQVVGQGGMGTVYKAEDTKLGHRLVAIKEIRNPNVLSKEEFDLASSALEQEALLLAKLSHPNLPSIYDHFAGNGRWYLVMEYISGVTLSQHLRNMPDGRLPIEDALNIGIKLSIVLNYLHQQEPPIIFSDLKPDNIMITDQGNLYLIDFGLARIFEENISKGTIGYSAPEQYESAYISPLADIYSLGVTLHEMLSGRHPVMRVTQFAPLRLGSAVWMLDLETIVMSMLNVNEKDRPPNMIVVRQALERIVDLRLHEEHLSVNAQLQDTEMPQGELRLAPSARTGKTFPLPKYISSQDITFTYPIAINALAWSPDGSKLAIADQVGICVYIPSIREEGVQGIDTLKASRYWFHSDLKKFRDEAFPSLDNNPFEDSTEDYDPPIRYETNYPWSTVNTGSGALGGFPTADVRQKMYNQYRGSEAASGYEHILMAWSPDSAHLIIAGTLLGRNLLVLDVTSESKRSTSLNVPKEMQARYDEITQLTDAFSATYLNDEYRDLCRQLTATLCRKRPSPLAGGKAKTWACAIIHALGMANFLFDSSQTPHVSSKQICEYFHLSPSTMQAKSKQIRDLLNITQLDVNWTLDVTSEEEPIAYAGLEKGTEVLAWSPDGRCVASGGIKHTAIVQEAKTGHQLSSKMHSGSVTALAWSPDSRFLASASTDGSIHVWETATGRDVTIYKGHIEYVYDIQWTLNGQSIISCGADYTVQIWDAQTGVRQYLLEAHTNSVRRIAFFDHGHFLISVSRNSSFYVWNTDNWTMFESFTIGTPLSREEMLVSVLAFHPTAPFFAVSVKPGLMRLFAIDFTQIRKDFQEGTGIQYTNAKVVLLGDSGVGKTGLGLVLSRNHFVPTESTHGRTVWTLTKSEDQLADGQREIREILLWDLAGQPGYRLVHQLYLHEVSVALIVFDGHSETDPFAGILHWVRALRTAQRVLGSRDAMKVLLVLARIDRSGKRVSRERINELMQRLGLDDYYETSAKEGKNIAALTRGINQAIDWEKVPKVTSTKLFHSIREFMVKEKQMGRLLSTIEELYKISPKTRFSENDDISAEFVTGIKLLDSAGLIRRLNFGNLVLLQPELLDTYASALVNSVRDEPDGLGSIPEEAVLTGKFYIPAAKRITDSEQEKLLLIAMVQDLLFYEIALREQGEDGPYLVFPSESTRENPDLPNPENASTVFTFEGPVLNIYATLAVRLSHSGLFFKKELWKNAIIYGTKVGGMCGIWLEVVEDGKGALTLFFDEDATNETRFHFEEYVQVHLQRKALPETVISRQIYKCEVCRFVASDQLIRMRAERGFKWFNCPVCGTEVDFRDHKERLRGTSLSRVPEMDTAADLQRALATAQSTVQGKQETKDFDVFLCYNVADRLAIIDIANGLKERGFLPWLDEWELQPGLPWQSSLELQIAMIRSAAVFVGAGGIGPWQRQEIDALLRQFVKRGCPVIPVILSNAPLKPDLPTFLEGLRWVDFRKQFSNYSLNPMEELIWGILGRKR